MRPVEMMARVELLLQSGGFSLGQLSNCLEGRRGLVLEIVKDVGPTVTSPGYGEPGGWRRRRGWLP